MWNKVKPWGYLEGGGGQNLNFLEKELDFLEH
jgi:hypothetical protein